MAFKKGIYQGFGFKKGVPSWNKGKHIYLGGGGKKGEHYSPDTEFKKGDKINKGRVHNINSRYNMSLSHIGKMAGVNNLAWKGDFASIGTMHSWVKRWKGQPTTCEDCGKTGLTGHQIHWSNVDHEYHRRLEDYVRRCAYCHMQYDLINCLRKNAKNYMFGK